MSNQRIDRKSAASPASLAQFQPHKAESYFFQVVAPPAAGGSEVIVQGPNFQVPPGATITVRSASIATATPGQGDVYVSDLYEALYNLNGSRVMHVLAGSSQLIPVAVNNLSELWFTVGNVANGGTVAITVALPQVG